MPTKTNFLLKYFDDGIVQYWWSSNKTDRNYRITAQPSGTTIDKISPSWNGRECWQVAYSGFKSLLQAEEFLHVLIDEPNSARKEQDPIGNKGFRVSEVLSWYRVA